jgi:hypothetical protein
MPIGPGITISANMKSRPAPDMMKCRPAKHSAARKAQNIATTSVTRSASTTL